MVADSTLVRLFAQNLRRIRMEKGVTQVEMAERMGIAQSGYAGLEGAKNAPTLATVEKCAVALSVPADELLKPDRNGKKQPIDSI